MGGEFDLAGMVSQHWPWVLAAGFVIGLAGIYSAASRAKTRMSALESPVVPGAAEPATRYRALVAPFGLLLVSYPAFVIASPRLSELILVLPVPLLAILILLQVSKVAWPALWLASLAVVYAFSSWDSGNHAGFIHTVTLISVGVCFLAFAAYGSALMGYAGMRLAIAAMVVVNVLVVVGNMPNKNTTGGVLIYLLALLCVVFIKNGWTAVALLTVAGVGIGIALDFRALIAYVAIFAVSFLAATRLRHRTYRWAGIALAGFAVGGVLWFNLNITTSELAVGIADRIEEWSDRRTNSGREYLWPRLLAQIDDNLFFGLGAGTLPRDLLSTTLSSHNYYIQVLLQVGIIGLALLLLFLLAVWTILSKGETVAGRFGSALFLMFVVHNSTETLMFQNTTLVAVPAWCAIGIAVSFEIYNQPGSLVVADGGRHTRPDRAVVPA
ncbi:O-antigen ligase family protein [Mycolicibacterium elephantis]